MDEIVVACLGSIGKLTATIPQVKQLTVKQVVASAHNTSPQAITRDAFLEMFREGQKPGFDFLLIDVRREDHNVSFN
jgi:hypothetical protein